MRKKKELHFGSSLFLVDEKGACYAKRVIEPRNAADTPAEAKERTSEQLTNLAARWNETAFPNATFKVVEDWK